MNFIDDHYDRDKNPLSMKFSKTIQTIRPARALLAALGLGLIAAFLESATQPVPDNRPVPLGGSLCRLQSFLFNS
jgi:hypothetical protein